MNYTETLDYIKNRDAMGIIPGLNTINGLLSRLGNPQKDIPAVHIAGTNGKGSIMAFVEESLVEMGLRVGRYISPSVFDYRDKWLLNKEWASESDVAWALTEAARKAEEMESDGLSGPTVFELETAAAFLLFKKWQVDIILLECGMGGRLDATNVDFSNKINILASVSMDHMQYLGDSISSITKEKLGIVHPGQSLVVYPGCNEMIEAVKDFENEYSHADNDAEITITYADASAVSVLSETPSGSVFTYKGKTYEISLAGDYQIYNAITAIEALELIISKFGGTYDIISRGLQNTVWDGRFTVIKKKNTFIIDGAHNEDAWNKLRESLDKCFTNKKFVYIISVLADKEYLKMIDILGPTIEKVYCVTSSNKRALDSKALCQEFKRAGIDAESAKNMDKALDAAMDFSTESSKEIVITGTLSVLGDIIKCIKSMP